MIVAGPDYEDVAFVEFDTGSQSRAVIRAKLLLAVASGDDYQAAARSVRVPAYRAPAPELRRDAGARAPGGVVVSRHAL